MPKTTLIVSDLHLTPEFDLVKFDYLKKLFESADRLIVNGDLWSYYYCDFADFLNSDWRKLFPLMLKKRCIYIHGNHDRLEWCDKNMRLFSIENHNHYSFTQNGNIFNVQHGHLISKMSVKSQPLIKFIKKYHLDKVNNILHNLAITKLGNKIYAKPGIILNKKYKKFIKRFIPHGEFLICGHTHSPEASPEKRYLNSGFINYGSSSYLRINEKISLVQETY